MYPVWEVSIRCTLSTVELAEPTVTNQENIRMEVYLFI
jgi:hypothetical protein